MMVLSLSILGSEQQLLMFFLGPDIWSYNQDLIENEDVDYP